MANSNKDGEVIYTLRADDDRLEGDLAQAEKKIKESTKKTADDTVKTEEKKTKDIIKESDKVVKNAEKAADNVADAWEDAGADANKAMSSIDVEDKNITVRADVSEAKSDIGSLEADDITIDVDAEAGKAESVIDSISKDKSVKIDVDANTSGAESDIKGLADVADDVSEDIEESFNDIDFSVLGAAAKNAFTDAAASTLPFVGAMGGVTTGLSGSVVAVAGVGAAAVGAGALAVNAANDMKVAMNGFLSETGKSKEETERYQDVLEDIYANNYGDSFEDIGQAMADVTKNLGDLDDVSLQTVTESAFALRDTFGYDIPESTRAAKAMMDNFGIDGEKAMNLIATGAQNGLDYSGELMDSISEYSGYFETVGLDADDMFKIFEKGAETGAWNLDKVGDAVKEMSIRVIDGSESTREGFETIGLDADEMASKFAAGGDSAKEAFNKTIDALAGIEDPLEQNAAGVALFGTMWEDLGPEVVTQLADIQNGAYATGEELDGIKDIKYDDLASMFEALKRNVELLLIPLGEQLMPVLIQIMEEVLPPLVDALGPLLEIIGLILAPLLTLVSECLQPILDILLQLAEPFMELIEACLTPLMELVQAFLTPLLALIDSCIKPLLDLVLQLIEPLLAMISTCIQPLIEVFTQLFEPIFNLIQSAFTPLLELLKPIVEFISSMLIPTLEILLDVFESVFKGIAEFVIEQVERVQEIFESLIEFIKNVFTGNWREAWQNIVDIFKNLIDGIADFFKAPINAIVDGWNSLAGSLGSFDIPEWVPIVGGGTFSLPTLPRLKVGMDYVPSDYFPAYLDEGEAVLTKQENAMYRQLGGLQGMFALQNQQSFAPAQPQSEIDYERIGQETAKAMKGMGVYLDKKPVGKIMAPTISEEMGKINERRT